MSRTTPHLWPDAAAPATRSRRAFLAAAAGTVLGALTGSAKVSAANEERADNEPIPARLGVRRANAYRLRLEAARAQLLRPRVDHVTNGDEQRYSQRFANFSKGLPHDALGHVEPAAYAALLHATESGRPSDFDRIPRGGTTRLTNPQAGLAFQLEGADPEQLVLPPPPAFATDEAGGELAELYWMALARDIPFAEYQSSALILAAADDLTTNTSFAGPRTDGRVTPETIFRGAAPGNLAGPFISQFLWLAAPFGAEQVDRRIRTAVPGIDYLTSYADWLGAQNGEATGAGVYDDTRRYIRNGRDLATWVHKDVLFQLAFDAFLTLVAMGAPLSRTNPYSDAIVHDGEVVARVARNQLGFGTLGEPYIASLIGTVARLAVSSVWYQKWFVHRRLRPEEYAGRVHHHLRRATDYPVPPALLTSEVLERVSAAHGGYLLAQAYPEGAPTHPAYGAGHATVAGATVTILKAFFDESFIIPQPVETNLVGTGVFPYDGPDLTVGGELNKLAFNIATGRNFAGIHWRTDMSESIRFGEEIAVRFLQAERLCLNETFDGFTFTRFDGTGITI
jgi:hypothetical protein